MQAVITNYEEATAKIRETAKWFATSGAALGALLIGTSPLAGLGDLTDHALLVAVLWGLLALGGLCWLVMAASNVLSPRVDELEHVANATEYMLFREQVRCHPRSYFGAWPGTVPAFAKRRAALFQSQERIRALLQDPSTSPTDRVALKGAWATVTLNVQRSGWIVQRLLAAADHHLTWARFRSARRQSVGAVVLVVVGITGFLSSVGAAESAVTASGLTGPYPVRVALTESGRALAGLLLGPGCATDDFAALLTEGGVDGPWTLMVTDDDCTNGQISLTAEQGTVLLPAGTG